MAVSDILSQFLTSMSNSLEIMSSDTVKFETEEFNWTALINKLNILVGSFEILIEKIVKYVFPNQHTLHLNMVCI